MAAKKSDSTAAPEKATKKATKATKAPKAPKAAAAVELAAPEAPEAPAAPAAPAPVAARPAPAEADIRARAHALWMERGGSARQNWLDAEAELSGR